LDQANANAFKYVVKHPKTILALSGMVVGVSLIGIYRMEVNNYLLEDLSEDDPVNQQYIFFEKHYDGVRPFEAQLNFDEENSRLYSFQYHDDGITGKCPKREV
jgi:predicted RND superfamily exporter protein